MICCRVDVYSSSDRIRRLCFLEVELHLSALLSIFAMEEEEVVVVVIEKSFVMMLLSCLVANGKPQVTSGKEVEIEDAFMACQQKPTVQCTDPSMSPV